MAPDPKAAPTVPCPICEKPVQAAAGARAPAFPFCGDRCRKIDLGQWLGEGYRIPSDEEPAGADDPEGDGAG